ncbi:MAG: hypothetical protein HN348_10060, partial [Proteobacteria bacterium]|nr:hypothetical protein [Pseudomonadota bacterium]
TYWLQEGSDLVSATEDILEELEGAVAMWIADWLGEVEGVTAERVRLLAMYQAGQRADAIEVMKEIAAGKKPKKVVFWWLGRMLARDGKKKEASEALERFLAKAGKKAAWRKEAKALLAEIKN